MDMNKKDNIVLLVVLYFLPFCFWIGNHNGIRSGFDFYIFISALVIMCIIPFFVLELKARRNV